MYKHIGLIALMATIGSPLMAQELQLNGASIEGYYRSYTDDDFDYQPLTFSVGADVKLGSSFAIGANVASYSASGDNASDETALNITAHGMYLLNPNTAIGVFATSESLDEDDVSIVGLEVGSAAGNSRFEAYFGVTDVESIDDDITVGGLSIEFVAQSGLILGLSYDSFNPTYGTVVGTGEVIEVRTGDTELFIGYDFGNGFDVTGSIGQISQTAVEDGTSYSSIDPLEYIAFSAGYKFGANGAPFMSERTYLGFGG